MLDENQDWIICTTRQKLEIAGETVARVEPMSLLESVDLFARRGAEADPRFELGVDNRALVCELVEQMDRLPLAMNWLLPSKGL